MAFIVIAAVVSLSIVLAEELNNNALKDCPTNQAVDMISVNRRVPGKITINFGCGKLGRDLLFKGKYNPRKDAKSDKMARRYSRCKWQQSCEEQEATGSKQNNETKIPTRVGAFFNDARSRNEFKFYCCKSKCPESSCTPYTKMLPAGSVVKVKASKWAFITRIQLFDGPTPNDETILRYEECLPICDPAPVAAVAVPVVVIATKCCEDQEPPRDLGCRCSSDDECPTGPDVLCEQGRCGNFNECESDSECATGTQCSDDIGECSCRLNGEYPDGLVCCTGTVDTDGRCASSPTCCSDLDCGSSEGGGICSAGRCDGT